MSDIKNRNKFEKKVQSLLKKRKTLKENSIKTYTRNIALLREHVGYTKNNFLFLDDTAQIVEIINEKYKTTSSRKTIYNSIYTVIKDTKLTELTKDFYYKKMTEYRTQLNKETDENKMSESQKEKWTSWDNITRVPELIGTEMKALMPLANKRKKLQYFNLYKKYMISSLYTKLPPIRLDYYQIKIFDTKQRTNDINYIVINDEEVKLYLNDYKNVKKMGKVVLDYPENVEKDLRTWYKFKVENDYPSEYLFYSSIKNNTLFTSNSFGKFLTLIFNKYIKIPITVNMLRHIYETELITSDKYTKMTIGEKQKNHNKLLHDFSTAQRYVKLDNFIKIFDGVAKMPKEINMNDTDKIKELLQQMGITVT